MEEFYRRKYISTTYNRPSTYYDAIEKDKTLADLRKELESCQEMDKKFDELCLDIVKLERQNKKLQLANSELESDYLQKIKINKMKIVELKEKLNKTKGIIIEKEQKAKQIENQNESLLSELRKIKKEAQINEKQKKSVKEQIDQKNQILRDYQQKLNECLKKEDEEKRKNEEISKKLQTTYDKLKSEEESLREGQIQCQNLQNQYKELLSKNNELIAKSELTKNRLNIVTLQHEAEILSLETLKRDETQIQHLQKKGQSILQCQDQIQKKQSISSEQLFKLNVNRDILLSSLKSFENDQIYYEKHVLKYEELKKLNQKLKQVIRNSNESLKVEQINYKKIIEHMRISIIRDEKAIESLAKQAAQLQNIVS